VDLRGFPEPVELFVARARAPEVEGNSIASD
jgi:hypothetical protein